MGARVGLLYIHDRNIQDPLSARGAPTEIILFRPLSLPIAQTMFSGPLQLLGNDRDVFIRYFKVVC